MELLKFKGSYEPTGHYILKSGEYAGMSLEKLMFEDYHYLVYLKDKNRGNDNKLTRHLNWLLARGDDRKPQAICPICKRNTITCLSIRWSSYTPSFGANFTYCDNCKRNAFIDESVKIYIPKFSLLHKMYDKNDQENMVGLLKEIFVLPEQMSSEIAFAFFSGKTQTPYDIF